MSLLITIDTDPDFTPKEALPAAGAAHFRRSILQDLGAGCLAR